MSEDILARLESSKLANKIIRDAAAEIRRLTADLDILKRHYNLHPEAPLSREEALVAKDAEIERLQTLLRHAKEKLQIYRREHSGEYVGGMEYSALISEINWALEDK